MTQRVPNKMDKIKGDTFVDVYLIGSIKSLNIRVDQSDKKSQNINNHLFLNNRVIVSQW